MQVLVLELESAEHQACLKTDKREARALSFLLWDVYIYTHPVVTSHLLERTYTIYIRYLLIAGVHLFMPTYSQRLQTPEAHPASLG